MHAKINQDQPFGKRCVQNASGTPAMAGLPGAVSLTTASLQGHIASALTCVNAIPGAPP